MKRHLRTLIVFLLLGAIINIAVAWGCILWSSGEFGSKPTTSSAGAWPGRVPSSWPAISRSINAYDVFGLTEVLAYGQERQTTTIEWEFQDVVQVGLPVRSLYSERHCMANPWFSNTSVVWEAKTWSDGISIPFSLQRNKPYSRQCLPTLPIWPGFAINTIFYAAILWLVFAAPFALRRWRRIKRGLCPACAYPVGTSSVCTECGKPVKSRAVCSASPS